MNAEIRQHTDALPAARLQEMALHLINDHQLGADEVLSAVLASLEHKMPGAEYLDFCRELENSI
jgi:hypothetical protein